MFSKLKKYFYFFFAAYFKFFAKIQLQIWNPRVIVITGSNGKTTLLHLLESQLKDEAKYSHLANSSFGIPFNILGLKRKNFSIEEWLTLFLSAPIKAFKKKPKEKLYIVEADCDRPHEGKFLASLLTPEVTLWVSVSRTHSLNFDKLVKEKKHPSVEKAIAHEFGYFVEYAFELAIVNGDSKLINEELNRTKSTVKKITMENTLTGYKVSKQGTQFIIGKNTFSFKELLPKDTFYAIEMCKLCLEYLDKSIKTSFPDFKLPPGRSSVFKGVKKTTIIDSTYNATPASVYSVLEMFKEISASNKWIILGDMIELGDEEKEEHEKLANTILSCEPERVILVGPRLSAYTFPKLKSAKIVVEKFEKPHDALKYLNENINGNELLLFKGARFLEGIIESLLENKEDIKKLPRREKVWQKRRKQWGL